MKKIMTTVLFLSFIAVSQGDLLAKERYGAQILVHKKNGQRFIGELIAVKQNQLLLLSASNVDTSINIEDVRAIDVVRRPYVGLGLLMGSIMGYLVGASIASAEGHEQGTWGYFDWVAPGIFIGGSIGATASGIHGIDKRIRIHERSEKEVQIALEKLRKIARVPDYK